MMTSILGGVGIGVAAGLLFLIEGRIAGVSGMLTRGLDPSESERAWRLVFLAGLAAGGAIVGAIVPGTLSAYDGSTALLAAAGALVGIGARIANGCTSGHGLCGVARGSRRSLAAVATFMGTGMATVLVVSALGGGVR
jgi:uncharacterized protein